MEARGWSECDVVIVTGDAYVDHPAFGAALVGRLLEGLGYRVGIIAQPDPRDPKAFAALGRPRLFWGVTAGNVDSQLARLTVMRKLRRDDPYSPGGTAGRRPANASIVYCAAVRHAARGVPVILGGIEASLRRFAYYDYWTDAVRRSLLFDAKADLIVYGMAERALTEAAARLSRGEGLSGIPGTAEAIRERPAPSSTRDARAFLVGEEEGDRAKRGRDGVSSSESGRNNVRPSAAGNMPALPNDAVKTGTVSAHDRPVEIPSYEEVSPPTEDGRMAFARMARLIHEHTRPGGPVLIQKHGDRRLVVHPPAAPLTSGEMDALYALPFTRRPHPAYGEARIPAYEMIRDSVTTHRGCYADCTFCAITAHQGAAITSRSEAGILAEIQGMAADPGFHGTISDLGGPTANMYGTGCRAERTGCPDRNCLFPEVCRNLRADHTPLVRLMRAVRHVKGVKHVFVSSGIRFDLALKGGGAEYIEELARHHVGGLLKIAPEHVSPRVLRAMRKPEVGLYRQFMAAFLRASQAAGRRQGVVEYFMSGHPDCTLSDMIELAEYLHQARVQPEQVQDFYPAPLTLAAAMFYTGLDPLTMKPVSVARTDREKALQRALLLHHQPEFQRKAREALREAGREDLIGRGKNCLVPPDGTATSARR